MKDILTFGQSQRRLPFVSSNLEVPTPLEPPFKHYKMSKSEWNYLQKQAKKKIRGYKDNSSLVSKRSFYVRCPSECFSTTCDSMQ